MRKLKVILADEKPYTFSTLTLKEQTIARRLETLTPAEQTEIEELMNGMQGNATLDTTKNERLLTLQSKQIKNLIKILMMSLAKAQPDQFVISEKNTEDKIIDSIEGLIDIRDMRRFASFALLGTLPVEEEEGSFNEEIIDLTAGK
jgi:hypothetical protein